MSSPDYQLLLAIISIDRKNPQAVYIQIAQQLIQAIQRKVITVGSKLPGTRTLATKLGINRNTLVAAYEELALQGWITIIPNKGAFVIEKPTNKALKAKMRSIEKEISQKNTFSYTPSLLLHSPKERSKNSLYFDEGNLDLSHPSLLELSKWYTSTMKRKQIVKSWNNVEYQSSVYLNKHLANYLNTTRGLQIEADQLCTADSRELLLYALSQLVLKPKDIVLVAELGDPSIHMIFQQIQARVITIPLDEEGIDVDFIRKKFVKGSIRMVYCTTNRQYPTTTALSPSRRMQLTQLAQEYSFAIIEDDPDFEMQWYHAPFLPLVTDQSIDQVWYIGTFASHLLPLYRKGFLVAPEPLLNDVKNYLQMIVPSRDIFMDFSIAEMIKEGEIHRQWKKSQLFYREKMDHLCHEIDRLLFEHVIYTKPHGGLAVFITLKKNFSLIRFKNICEEMGLSLPLHILFQNKNHCGIRLGFGHLSLTEITCAVEILKNAFEQLEK